MQQGRATYVVDTLDRPGRKESEGSSRAGTSVHCSDRPFPQQGLHTGPALDRRQADSQSAAVGDGHCQHRWEAEESATDQERREHPPGWPEQPEQRRCARALQQPCARSPPPSSVPSTPCGSP